MKWRHIIILLCMIFLIPLASAAPTTLTLEANPSILIADGVSYSKVRATLKDGNSSVVGAYISFTIGSKTLKVKTNSSGIATIKVGPSSSIQTIVINASTPSTPVNLTSSVAVAFVPATPASIHLYASPSSVGTRSITSTNYTSLIFARVLDKYKNPVPNQQVNFTVYLNGTNSTDFTLSPGTSITTDIKGSASLTFNAGNTSGTAYITATAGALYTNTNIKILGESYLLVETIVEPENIDPPAIVNVTISVKGGGDMFTGGMPVDAMLVTDVSGSMDPDWYNIGDDGEQQIIKGLTKYKFNASGTVQSGKWLNTTFNLNESVNDLWFKLNVTGLRLQLISPSNKTFGYNPTPLGEAVDNTNLAWTTGGNRNWYSQTSTYYYGEDAAQSGSISHNQATWINTTVTGPGTLKFYWKVSSQSNKDFLEFYIDGIKQTGISGNVNWRQKSYTISSGTHTLQWKYVKDGSGSSGQDAGWLDKVEFSDYTYSKNYPGSEDNPEWIWLKPDSEPGDSDYYPTSADSDFPEQGNWTINVYNPGPSPKTFNVTTYIEKLSAAKIASKTFNSLLNPAYDRVGLVPFTIHKTDGIYPLPLYNLTSDIASINGTIDSLFARSGTPTASAIKKATDHLIKEKENRPDALRYIILLSDGRPTADLDWETLGYKKDVTYCDIENDKCTPIKDAINESNRAKNNSIRIYTIGIGMDNDEATMRAIASPDSYYFAANASQLKEIYGNIGKQITNISAKQASLNISLSSGQSYSANATYVAGSSRQKYITPDNITIDYDCGGNACEPNSTSPLYWDIKTPHPPDNRTIKIGDQWILRFQLNLSSDGMLFDLEKSILDYMNYTGKNLSINVPGAKVSKNATALKPQGLLVKTVTLNVSKDKVKANGVSSSTITATVLDEEDNLVPDGTLVIFHTDLGSFSRDPIITEYSTSTVGGVATAQIYSKVVGTANIYAESKAEWQQDYIQSPAQNLAFSNTKIITIS